MAICFVCSIFDWTHKNLENEAFLLVAIHRVCMWRYFRCFCHQQCDNVFTLQSFILRFCQRKDSVVPRYYFQDGTWLLLHEVVAPPPVWYWLKHIWVFVTSDLPLQASLSRPACPGQLVQASLSRPACPAQLVQASLSSPASPGQLLHGNFSRPGQLLQVRPAFSGLPLNRDIVHWLFKFTTQALLIIWETESLDAMSLLE